MSSSSLPQGPTSRRITPLPEVPSCVELLSSNLLPAYWHVFFSHILPWLLCLHFCWLFLELPRKQTPSTKGLPWVPFWATVNQDIFPCLRGTEGRISQSIYFVTCQACLLLVSRCVDCRQVRGSLCIFLGEGNGTPFKYFCLENPMDGGAWWAAVHGVAKSRTWLSDFTFTFHFHALEKEMATHSSVLAWRIPGMAEPGGLPFLGSHRVGHNWNDLAAAAVLKSSLYSYSNHIYCFQGAL